MAKSINKKFNKPSLKFFPGRFVFLLSLAFVACTTDPNQAKELTEQQTKIMIETGTGVEMIYTQNGKPNLKISAPKALRYNTENPYIEFSEGMIMLMYDEAGNLETTLTANYGKMADNSSDLEAKDNVIVINKDNEQLNTEHLIWDKNEEVIKSESFVKITTKDEILFGKGFISDDKFTDYTIFNITGTVKIKDGL
jgi:LPS export ABC transporter protein LptC